MWLHEGVARSFVVLYGHGTCLNIAFHGMKRDGECYGGYDQMSAMAQGILVALKTGGTGLPMCRVFGDLQQRLWQEGVATQVDCIFGDAPRVPSCDFQGESSRSGLHWLYLAMAFLKALFCELGLSPG